MKAAILTLCAMCLTRAIFWFGGVDLLARNNDGGLAMFISVAVGLMAYFGVKGDML